MLILSMGMPTSAQELMVTNYWYILYGAQIPLQLFAIFIHGFILTEDTPVFCIKNGFKEDAIRGLRKIYPNESKAAIEQMYEEKSELMQSQQSMQDNIWNVFI